MTDVNVNHLIHLSLVKIAKNLQSRKGCELRRTLLLSSLLDRARFVAATPGSESNEMMLIQEKMDSQGSHKDADDNYDESENQLVCQQSRQGMEDLSAVSMECESTTDDTVATVDKEDQTHNDMYDNCVEEQPRLQDHSNTIANKRKLTNKDQVVPGDTPEMNELEYYNEEDGKDQNSLVDLCSPAKRIKVY